MGRMAQATITDTHQGTPTRHIKLLSTAKQLLQSLSGYAVHVSTPGYDVLASTRQQRFTQNQGPTACREMACACVHSRALSLCLSQTAVQTRQGSSKASSLAARPCPGCQAARLALSQNRIFACAQHSALQHTAQASSHLNPQAAQCCKPSSMIDIRVVTRVAKAASHRVPVVTGPLA
jgi:hypothetical protein